MQLKHTNHTQTHTWPHSLNQFPFQCITSSSVTATSKRSWEDRDSSVLTTEAWWVFWEPSWIWQETNYDTEISFEWQLFLSFIHWIHKIIDYHLLYMVELRLLIRHKENGSDDTFKMNGERFCFQFAHLCNLTMNQWMKIYKQFFKLPTHIAPGAQVPPACKKKKKRTWGQYSPQNDSPQKEHKCT